MTEIESSYLKKLDDCINTYSGIRFNLLKPEPEMVNIIDIAKGLAYKAHFGGQTPFYFSIAQHSILVHNLTQVDYFHNKDILLATLLHDASEAYIGDMVKPLKVHLSNFCEIEDRITSVIFEAFGLDIELMKIVKKYDIEAFKIEYAVFFENMKFLVGEEPDESCNNYVQMISKYVDIEKFNSM